MPSSPVPEDDDERPPSPEDGTEDPRSPDELAVRERLYSLWARFPALVEVAESPGIRESAKRLHVAPSGVSRAIQTLEAQLGVPLFEREGGNTLTLNEHGRRLYDALERSLDLLASAVQQIEADREPPPTPER